MKYHQDWGEKGEKKWREGGNREKERRNKFLRCVDGRRLLKSGSRRERRKRGRKKERKRGQKEKER